MAMEMDTNKTSFNDLLTHLNIGRQRDGPRPNGRFRRPRPNRRPGLQPTARPDEHVHSYDDDVGNTTTRSIDVTIDDTTLEPSVDMGNSGEPGNNGENDHDDDDHDHATDDDFTCQPTTSQHSAYIRENLEMLQKKCNEFQACTKEVYSAENFHRILSGGNIQLSNMCGLMYANGGGKYTTLNEQCSRNERRAIRQDIGSELTKNLAELPKDNTKPTWRKLRRCLNHNRRPGEKYIDTVCRLKRDNPLLCMERDVDRMTEEFFNHEMEHLHCSCKAISAEAAKAQTSSSSVPTSVRIGIAAGVAGLLVILIVVVIVLCFRHRRMKRELDKHRMQYLPSPHGEPSAIYQEIGDHTQAMDALRRARDQGSLPAHYNHMGQAPALPERYVKEFSGSRPNLTDLGEGEHEYLEPLPDIDKGRQLEAHANDAYNASQSSQRSGVNVYDLAKNPESSPPPGRHASQAESDTYFDMLNLRQTGNSPEDRNYSPLGHKPGDKLDKGQGTASTEEEALLNKSDEAEDASGPGESQYFVLESQTEPSENDALTASGPTVPV